MKIFYHSADNDGRASASIIYGEYGIMAMMTENDFIGYDYNKPYELPEFKEGEPWYFVDISLNPETSVEQLLGITIFLDNIEAKQFYLNIFA